MLNKRKSKSGDGDDSEFSFDSALSEDFSWMNLSELSNPEELAGTKNPSLGDNEDGKKDQDSRSHLDDNDDEASYQNLSSGLHEATETGEVLQLSTMVIGAISFLLVFAIGAATSGVGGGGNNDRPGRGGRHRQHPRRCGRGGYRHRHHHGWGGSWLTQDW